jgi:hypothetical protein
VFPHHVRGRLRSSAIVGSSTGWYRETLEFYRPRGATVCNSMRPRLKVTLLMFSVILLAWPPHHLLSSCAFWCIEMQWPSRLVPISVDSQLLTPFQNC